LKYNTSSSKLYRVELKPLPFPDEHVCIMVCTEDYELIVTLTSGSPSVSLCVELIDLMLLPPTPPLCCTS
jgi:hypothetical protein